MSKKTAGEVKDRIREKFGTVTNFLRISGVDKLEFQKACMPFYANHYGFQKLLQEYYAMVDKIDVTPADDSFTDAIHEELKTHVYSYGSVEKFCEKYPEFSQVSVYQILAGSRKRISPLVNTLLSHARDKRRKRKT